MRKLTCVAVVSLAVMVLAPDVPAQGDKANYMPLKVGNTWTYKGDFAGMNITIVQKVTKIEKKDGKDVASIEKEFGGQTITDQMSSTDRGVFQHTINGQAIATPYQALRLPVKKGESWDAEVEVMGQKGKIVMKTEGEEEVTVAAGKYKAVIVSIEAEFGGMQIKGKNWYAPQVGIVKQTFDFGGMAGSMELEKLELKK